MAKRFTDSAKWSDPWFVSLDTRGKLAWFYLLDNCDAAGVLDLSERLAEFHLGGKFDWGAFIASSEGRIVRLPSGKLYLTKFVAWQYGELSEDCRPHKAVIALLGKHGITSALVDQLSKGIDTLSIPLANPSLRVLDKEKDKEKDKPLEGGVGETAKPRGGRIAPKDAIERIPPKFSLALREVACRWLTHKGEAKQNYTPTGLGGFFTELAKVAKDFGESVAIARIEASIGNGSQGWNYPAPCERTSRGSPKQLAHHSGPGYRFDPNHPTQDEF